jgi:hypothetical protein
MMLEEVAPFIAIAGDRMLDELVQAEKAVDLQRPPGILLVLARDLESHLAQRRAELAFVSTLALVRLRHVKGTISAYRGHPVFNLA